MAVITAAERAKAEARAAAEQAATAARLEAERVEEESRLDEALARSMASLQADEERRRAPTRVTSDLGQGAEATAASDRPVLTLADVGDITGRNAVPESSIGGETTCIVCMSQPKTHLAVPCGHQCACGACAEQMQQCPYCRAPVQKWIQVRVV